MHLPTEKPSAALCVEWLDDTQSHRAGEYPLKRRKNGSGFQYHLNRGRRATLFVLVEPLLAIGPVSHATSLGASKAEIQLETAINLGIPRGIHDVRQSSFTRILRLPG